MDHALEIVTPPLQRLYRDWDCRRRGREFPARRDFDVLDLKYVIGRFSLLEVGYDPLRFRYRLHGTCLAERVGEMTGRDLEELRPGVRELVRRHYTTVIERRTPRVEIRELQVVDNRIVHSEVLVLPLSADGTTIDMLISCVIWL